MTQIRNVLLLLILPFVFVACHDNDDTDTCCNNDFVYYDPYVCVYCGEVSFYDTITEITTLKRYRNIYVIGLMTGMHADILLGAPICNQQDPELNHKLKLIYNMSRYQLVNVTYTRWFHVDSITGGDDDYRRTKWVDCQIGIKILEIEPYIRN